MDINSNSGEIISLEEATSFTHSYQVQNPEAPKAFFVGREKLELILEQKDCMGIRAYNGYDLEKDNKNLVLVGVDQRGKDITDGYIIERLTACPNGCDLTSILIKQLS